MIHKFNKSTFCLENCIVLHKFSSTMYALCFDQPETLISEWIHCLIHVYHAACTTTIVSVPWQDQLLLDNGRQNKTQRIVNIRTEQSKRVCQGMLKGDDHLTCGWGYAFYIFIKKKINLTRELQNINKLTHQFPARNCGKLCKQNNIVFLCK